MNKLLINDINKFEQLIPLTYSLDESMLIPQSRISQEWLFEYVPPMMQDILVDDTIDEIQDENLKKLMNKINLYVHNTIANHIMLSLIDKIYIQATSGGISVQNTQTNERAPKWSVDRAKEAYTIDCYNAFNKFFELLENNRTLLKDTAVVTLGKKKGILTLYSECQNLSLKIDAVTFIQLKDNFIKQEENYIYSYVPKDLCDKMRDGIISNDVATEFLHRASDIILTATLYHNLFGMSIMIQNGRIASIPMLKNETTQQLTVPIEQLNKLQQEWERNLLNMQKSLGSFVLANEAVFGNTPYFTENTGTSILPKYDNANSGSFFM